VEWNGETVLTSIFKTPLDRRLRVTVLNFDGDQQSDLTVHGGAEKAIYLYPSEHYPAWREELPDADLGWAAFGENLTTEGLLGRDCWGGTAGGRADRRPVPDRDGRVRRHPTADACYKLGIRFGRPDVLRRMLKNGRTGFYLSVAVEGEVGAGDDIELWPHRRRP
jgi:MOSC domain-containing protein YiiM